MRFPFWLVTPIQSQVPAPHQECDSARVPLTFSSAGKMAAYLSARDVGQWEVRLVNRYSAAVLFREWGDLGYEDVCHDVEPDGSGGSTIRLNAILDHTTVEE
jgi:hypothetical protein